MKLYKSISAVAIFLSGMAMTGCSDWLDYTPKDKQTYDQQFATPDGFHTTVNGIYNSVYSNNLYGKNLSYGAIDGMGACYSVSTSNTSMNEFVSGAWTGTYASAGLKAIWSSAYTAILNINVVLDALEEFPEVLSADDSKTIKAEMLAMRAMLHLDLVRLFGPIPSVSPEGLTVPFAGSTEIVKRDRMPLDVIMTEHIIPDLTIAQSMLKEVDPVLTEGVLSSDGGDAGNWSRYRQIRLNYYAVTLLKARAYMWIGDYDNALAEARIITDTPEAQNTFPWVDPNTILGGPARPDRVFSTECLFGFYNSNFKNIFDNNFSGALDPAVVLQPRKQYVSILFSSEGDYRRQSQWTSSVSTTSDFDFAKYRGFTPTTNNPEFWATFFAMMRKGEAYLIKAECLMRADNLADAIAGLNEFRVHRGEADLLPTMTKTALEKEIKFEYLRELRGEGQIYFLHKRNNQAFGMYSSGGVYDFDASGKSSFTDSPSKTVRYNVPIPADENY